MALVVYWYDFVCFGIVVAAYVCSLWVLWRRELATRCEDNTTYESLLLARPDIDGFVEALPTNHVGSSQLWTSCWKGVRPGWLLCTRFISFLVMAGFVYWDINDWGPLVYVYYTEWTFTLVMVYFALATVTSAYGCCVSPSSENEVSVEFLKRNAEENGSAAAHLNYRDKEIRGTIQLQSRYAEEAIRQRAGFWGYFMQSVYQTCAGAVILTDLVFWCIIVPFGTQIAHLRLTLLMGCIHALNAGFLLIDTTLNNLPFPWFRIAYFVQWSCIYVVFQWVVHACGFTWWPYPFLELDTPWAPLWYFSLAVVHIPCYGLYALIVKAKYSIIAKNFPRAFLSLNR